MGARTAVLVGAALLCGACTGSRPETDPGDAPAPVVPAGDALYALAEVERQALFDGLVARVERAEGTDAAIDDALELARLATAIVRLGGSTRHLDPARQALRAATASGWPGACAAALALARLEASASRDLAAAHAAAHDAARRFAGSAHATECVREAQRMLGVVSEHAAPGAARAAEDSHQAIGDSQVAQWAAERSDQATDGARLEEVVVYGADPSGERPQAERDARVVLRFTGVAVYRRGTLPAEGGLPPRVFLDLEGAQLAPALARVIEVGAGGLTRVRVVELGGGNTRVSFDVRDTAVYRLFFLTDPYRIVMDFRDSQHGPKRATAGGPLVVLDAGHGGDQPGAKGPDGLRESDVALSLARRVRASLRRRRPDVQTVLTRDDDRFLTLEERTALANGHAADLFVSIHLNASHSPEDKGGVSTFVLDTTDDQAALRLAARENGTDEAGVSQLQFILASLYRADQVEHSLALAHEVQRATLTEGRKVLPALYDRGVKRALFYVLVGATMPAVLVEASFITRPEEAVALRTDEYRDALSEGMAEGIVRYLERPPKARP